MLAPMDSSTHGPQAFSRHSDQMLLFLPDRICALSHIGRNTQCREFDLGDLRDLNSTSTSPMHMSATVFARAGSPPVPGPDTSVRYRTDAVRSRDPSSRLRKC